MRTRLRLHIVKAHNAIETKAINHCFYVPYTENEISVDPFILFFIGWEAATPRIVSDDLL
jgi:hypothetical protein